jgi:Ca2+/Na+ antiporter
MNIIMKNNTKLWLENPSVFILNNGFLNFIPTREMNKTEQINASTLFLLYILIFTNLFKISNKYVNTIALCLIVFMIILYYGYYNKVEKMDNEKMEDENDTIGIILCKDKKDSMVEISLPKNNKQIFASKYQFYLPTEEQLLAELSRIG